MAVSTGWQPPRHRHLHQHRRQQLYQLQQQTQQQRLRWTTWASPSGGGTSGRLQLASLTSSSSVPSATCAEPSAWLSALEHRFHFQAGSSSYVHLRGSQAEPLLHFQQTLSRPLARPGAKGIGTARGRRQGRRGQGPASALKTEAAIAAPQQQLHRISSAAGASASHTADAGLGVRMQAPAAAAATAAGRPGTAAATAAAAGTAEGRGERRRAVVCGGGVVGACVAFYLSQKNVQVTVVEKTRVACAASGKAGGFLAKDWCQGPVDSLARLSFSLHQQLAGEFGHRYEYRAVDTLSVQVQEQMTRASGETNRTSAGSASPSAAVAAAGLPAWVDGPVRGVRQIGTKSTTAQVHPRLFTETLLDIARERYGVTIQIGEVQDVRVEETARGKRAVSGVVVDGETVPADVVVVAMGPWSSKNVLLRGLVDVSGLKANSIVIEPKAKAATTGHMLFLQYRSKLGKVSDPEVYPRASGQVYVCGMSRETEVPDSADEVLPDDGAPSFLRQVAATVSSELSAEASDVVVEQACFLPCTDDGVPVIGAIPAVEGAYAAAGHSCWGILNAPATGFALAELIVEGTCKSVNLTPFSPDRFTRSRAELSG